MQRVRREAPGVFLLTLIVEPKGEESMRRITVVCSDRQGLIADVTELISSHHLNIIDIEARSVGKDAVLSIGVEDEARALSALTKAGYQAMTEDVLMVTIADQPGTLARVARRLAESRMDIRGVSFVSRNGGQCIVALDTSDNAGARKVLADLAF
jgi:hypothetical protein